MSESLQKGRDGDGVQVEHVELVGGDQFVPLGVIVVHVLLREQKQRVKDES